MKFVNYKVQLRGDTITIPLDRPCRCKVGLVEISMSEINSAEEDYDNAIDITCDQIDSSFDNPDRLLRRIPFNKIADKKYYHTWTAWHIQMMTVDSEDKFLTLKVRRTYDNTPLMLGKIFQDNQILLTLAFSEPNADVSWATYINRS